MITVPIAYAKSLIGILNVSTIDADLLPAGAQSAVCASWAGCNRQLHPSIYIYFYPLHGILPQLPTFLEHTIHLPAFLLLCVV